MHRIDHPTAAVSLPDPEPAGTPGYFQEGNPSGGVEATVVNADIMNDIVENLMRLCELSGLTPTKGRGQDLYDAVKRVFAVDQKGLLIGRFDWISNTQVRLSRAYAGTLSVEIDNVVTTQTASDVTFDITLHLSGPAETPSTWYYCYLENVAGVLTPHISATPPALTSGKILYHPTNLTWRFVEAFYNGSDGHIAPFLNGRDGAISLQKAIHAFNLGTVAASTYQAIDVSAVVPATAREVLVCFRAYGDGWVIYVSGAPLFGLDVLSNISPHSVTVSIEPLTATTSFGQLEAWIPLDATRRVVWGAPSTVAPTGTALFEMIVGGWR